MFVLSAGKGGAGKTSVAAQLLSFHAARGGRALGIDCDTNQALYAQFPGATEPPALMDAIGELLPSLYDNNAHAQDPTQAPKSLPPSSGSPLYYGISPEANPLVAAAHAIQPNGVISMRTGELPAEDQLNHCNHYLVGAGLRFGLHTVTGNNELTVADMMAGNDNATSGLPSMADGAFVVVMPNAESLGAYRQIATAYEQLGVPNIVVVANQIEDDDDLAFITDRIDHDIACVLPRNRKFFRALSAGENPELPAEFAAGLTELHRVVSGQTDAEAERSGGCPAWKAEAPEAKYLRVVNFHNKNYPDLAIPTPLAEAAATSYAARVTHMRAADASTGAEGRRQFRPAGPRSAHLHGTQQGTIANPGGIRK